MRSPIPWIVPITSIEANPLWLRFRVVLTLSKSNTHQRASKLLQKRTDSKRPKDKSLSFIKENLELILFIVIDFSYKIQISTSLSCLWYIVARDVFLCYLEDYR